MKKIKIAQIGAGHDHSADAMTTLKRHSDIYEVVGYAVVEGDEEFYETRKSVYEDVLKMTVDEILNYRDLDAVCIETEDRRLTEFAIKAAEKGLHIQMDKPGSESDEDFDRLIDLVKEKNLIFHVGYMYRYNPEILKLKKDIKEGKLGEIFSVEAQMSCIHSVEKRKWLGNYPGGMLYFLGCHLIDLVYSICGEPEEVIPLSQPVGTDSVTADDFGMAILRYKNGVSSVKSTAVEVGGFDRRHLIVCGTKGTVTICPLETQYWNNEYPDFFVPETSGVKRIINENGNIVSEAYQSEVFGRYDAMFCAFADYVNGERQNPYDYEYERKLHKLILKACGR